MSCGAVTAVSVCVGKEEEHSHQVCQMSNIWHLTYQTPKNHFHEVF